MEKRDGKMRDEVEKMELEEKEEDEVETVRRE